MSLAVLAVLLVSIAGAPVVAADDEIETEFALVDNPTFTSGDGLGGGGVGTGKIEIDGEDLEDLEFELEIEAEGLTPNTWYYLSVTVREGFGGIAVPVAIAVVGTARTDDKGRLEFEGKGVLPNVFGSPATAGVTQWRIDQQVRQLGSGELANCVECILVCSPTTKVELVDGKLAQVS